MASLHLKALVLMNLSGLWLPSPMPILDPSRPLLNSCWFPSPPSPRLCLPLSLLQPCFLFPFQLCFLFLAFILVVLSPLFLFHSSFNFTFYYHYKLFVSLCLILVCAHLECLCLHPTSSRHLQGLLVFHCELVLDCRTVLWVLLRLCISWLV